MPKPRSTTRGRAARSTRDVILDAAEGCFAERGFAGVSVREIAAEAGLKNQASLYHHFRDKRALYEAVLARGIGTLLALVAEQAATGEAAPSSTQGAFQFERLLDYLGAHPKLPMLIQRAVIDDSRQLRDTATRLLRPLYGQGVNLLAASGGRWEQADLPHVGAGLYHLIFGYFANAALIEAVAQVDPRSPGTLARQRRFIKSAVSLLLGSPSGRGTRRRRTP